jgi:integration host factor subunit alpha
MENLPYGRSGPGRTLTKADIVEKVHERVGFSKKESSEIVDLVLGIVKETLINGEKIKISGFGNFAVREKKMRLGRNPRTGDELEISPRRVLTFRPSSILRKIINDSQYKSEMLPG